MKAERTVLCVDDEDSILRALHRTLRKEPYRVITTSDGEEAIRILGETDVSDQRMPKMQGFELLKKVKEKHPDAVRVILSGYADAGSILDSVNRANIFRFLVKPWDDETLRHDISDCISQYDLCTRHEEDYHKLNEQLVEAKHVCNMMQSRFDNVSMTLSLLQKVLEQLPLPTAVIGSSKTIDLANRPFRSYFGFEDASIIGRGISDVFSETLLCALLDHIDRHKRGMYGSNSSWFREGNYLCALRSVMTSDRHAVVVTMVPQLEPMGVSNGY